MALRHPFDWQERDSADFLEFCVRSAEMDPVFVCLARDYRESPTICKAVALYDIFCAPASPAKVRADNFLPPKDMRIENAMRPIKLNWTRMQAALVFGPPATISLVEPPETLFDAICEHLEKSDAVRNTQKRYEAQQKRKRGVTSRLNAFQRHFVERIWHPIIRPHLVAAGFFQLPAFS